MQRVLSIIISMLLLAVFLNAQTEDCPTCPPNGTVDQTEYDVIKTKDMMYEGEFVPGEILIKYKDEVNTVLGKSNKGTVITGITAVDAVFEKHQITEAKKLFPKAEKLRQKQILKSFNGYEFERPSLHNIQKLKISEEAERINIYEVIEELKQIPEIEYAEPNYIYAIVEDEAVSPELSEEEMIEWLKNNSNQTNINSTNKQINKSTNSNVVVPNDPLYDQQWGIPVTQIDAVWDSTTGNEDQIIAVLDTGVDWLHPDLKNKAWINQNEIPDNNFDDDNNGFIDDVHGWDFIEWDNNPSDFNGHGTHVAGIAAAEGNNGIGIAGVSWGAKIMPIKILDNKGRGDAANISQGIIYASQMNSSVINMSFGGYFNSLTMAGALLNAILKAELVASAGNDGKSINESMVDPRFSYTMYPAALPYVLGVQTSDTYSNYDEDGPIYSRYFTGENYELLSYGSGIISTFPGGHYRVLSGTSMAAPLIAGMISLYNSVKENPLREDRWSDFIHISRPVNVYLTSFYSASDKNPVFDLRSFEISDSLAGNDYDNQADAGETIEIRTRIRNTFGYSDSTFIKLQLDDISRPYYSEHIEFINNLSYLGSLGSFREKINQNNPFIIYLKPSFPNENSVSFELLMWNQGSTDTSRQTLEISVYNGTELSGILTGNIVLTPDRLWMINNSTRLSVGSTMKIMPGTRLIVNGSFDNRGYIEAIGTPDSIISIDTHPTIKINNSQFVNISCNDNDFYVDHFENGTIRNANHVFSSVGYFKNTVFDNIEQIYTNSQGSTTLKNCTLLNLKILSNALKIDTLISCTIQNSYFMYPTTKYAIKNRFIRNYYNNWETGPGFSSTLESNFKFEYNIFQDINNALVHFYPNWPASWLNSYLFHVTNQNSSKFFKNAFIINRNIMKMNILKTSGEDDYVNFQNNYFGTTNTTKIKKWILDFEDNASWPLTNLSPMMIPPSDSIPGFVWKVLINGKDAQDDYMDPLGVGSHRFDVYFNRPMNPEYTPLLSFGGIQPFTSNLVADSASWSENNKVWTAYHKLKLYTGDGINRIRVSGAKDLEGSEIPIEDQRFEFVIDAAGSASIDFQATAGLGRINLEWSPPDLTDIPDLLGYNMYRIEHIDDTTLTAPSLINKSLINDTLYTDFEVIPNKKYYYYYRVVRTDFSESDSSRVVGAQALTSSPGDANGDLAVNVLDITSMVSYLLNQNPQPFIFEAADVDTNGVINVLDIVKSINIIMGVTIPKLASKEQNAELAVDGNSIRIKDGEEISGIEFKVIGEGIENADIIGGSLLNGMEYGHSYNKDTLKVLVYNFKNKPFNAKEGELLKLSKGKIISVDEITAGDMNGNMVSINGGSSEVMIPDNYILYQNYPNPFNPTTTIKYGLPKPSNVEITIFNILGQRIKTFILPEQSSGYHQVIWNSSNSYGRRVSTGVYIYQIKTDKWVDQKKMLLLK